MNVRIGEASDISGCIAVLRSLPEYFTLSTHAEVHASMASASSVTFICELEGTVIAFVLAELRYPSAAEITYAAVLPEYRGKGVGTAILNTLLTALALRGVAIVEAKTLDSSSGYEPYIATRAFWEARGFIQIDCIDPLPGWDAGNPSAIYVKALPPSPAAFPTALQQVPAISRWQVVVLNGGSSSGKTTIATSLQTLLPGSWLRLNVDTLIEALGPDQTETLLPITDGLITVNPKFTRLEEAWMAGVAAIARSGANVLVEDGFLGGAASQTRWMEALSGLSTFWVGVICDEATAVRREEARRDRNQGMASSQRLLVHRGIRYHHILDTTNDEPHALAANLLAAMQRGTLPLLPHLTI
jgi:chloramphenicol 3-O phosphotransferase